MTEPLMCECKSPAHPWEPGESCPPERVVNQPGRELVTRAILALERLHEDPHATYEDMARAVLSLTSDEAEWWASERLDLQAECREANASEAAAIRRRIEAEAERDAQALQASCFKSERESVRTQMLDRLAKVRDLLPTRNQLYALTQAAEVALKVRLLVEDALDLIDDYSLDAASQPQRERPPNVLSQEEAQLVVKALLPAVSGTPEAALSDRLGDFAFPDGDEPYKPHPATVPGGTYLPPDAQPDSTGLPEFGELPSANLPATPLPEPSQETYTREQLMGDFWRKGSRATLDAIDKGKGGEDG